MNSSNPYKIHMFFTKNAPVPQSCTCWCGNLSSRNEGEATMTQVRHQFSRYVMNCHGMSAYHTYHTCHDCRGNPFIYRSFWNSMSGRIFWGALWWWHLKCWFWQEKHKETGLTWVDQHQLKISVYSEVFIVGSCESFAFQSLDRSDLFDCKVSLLASPSVIQCVHDLIWQSNRYIYFACLLNPVPVCFFPFSLMSLSVSKRCLGRDFPFRRARAPPIFFLSPQAPDNLFPILPSSSFFGVLKCTRWKV